MNHIIIEGFMGSGKSVVSKKLAKEMNLPLIDIDQKVAKNMKMTSSDIYDRFGEPYYRAMETFILVGLKDVQERSVIIIGSGLALMPQNEKYLKELGKVYFLQAKQEVIQERLSKGKKHDWLKEGDLEEKISKMLKERDPAYKRVADHLIDTDGKTASAIVTEIMALARADDEHPEEVQPETGVHETTEEISEKKPATVKKTAVKNSAAAKKKEAPTEGIDSSESKPKKKKTSSKAAVSEKESAVKPAAKMKTVKKKV